VEHQEHPAAGEIQVAVQANAVTANASEPKQTLKSDMECRNGNLLARHRPARLSNSSLVKATTKGKQNIAKYVNRLLDLHLIHPAERRGRNVYYVISPDLALVRTRSRPT